MGHQFSQWDDARDGSVACESDIGNLADVAMSGTSTPAGLGYVPSAVPSVGQILAVLAAMGMCLLSASQPEPQ